MNTLTGRLSLILGLGLLLPAALLAVPSPDAAAQPAQPLQVTVQGVDSARFPRVSVYITVADSRGIPIDGLTQSAFSLSEDGQPVPDDVIAVSPSERPDRPVSVVLALDISNSLGETGVEAVRNAAIGLLESLPPEAGDRIALITFGNANEVSITVNQGFTDDLAALRDIVAGLEIGPADAYTAFWGAAYEALALLENDPRAAAERRRAVVILTDGVDNSANGARLLPANTQRTRDEVVAYAQRLGVPIYPVSFGDQTDEAALEQLAVATQGLSHIGATPRDLELAFADVFATLRQEYRVDFVSALPADDAEHTLDIRVTYQAYTSRAQAAFVAVSHPVEVRLNLKDGQDVSGNVLIQPAIAAYGAITYGRLNVNGALLQEFGAGDIRYTWSTGQLAPGTYTLELFVRDSAGNTGADQITVNVVPPLVARITAPAPGERVAGQVDVTFEVENNVAEVNTAALFVDGREVASLVAPKPDGYAFTWDAAAAGEGGHQLEVVVRDTVGNQASASVVVNVAPALTVNLTAPAPHAEVSGEVAVAYTAEAIVAPPRNVILLVDGAPYAITPWGGPLFWNADLAALGDHTLEVRVVDEAGNAASRAVTVKVTRPLGVSITAPAEGARVAGAVGVTFRFVGRPADVTAVQFFVDDLELEDVTDGFVLRPGDNTLTWDAGVVETGLHGLEVRLIDTLGNVHADTTFADVVPPLVVILTAPGAEVTGAVTLGYSVETNAAALKNVALLVDGTVYAESQTAEGTFTWNSDEAALGPHTLDVVAADVAGNEARASVPVQVTRPLRVAIDAPAQGAQVAGQVLVRFTVEGRVEDVARAEFWVEGRRLAAITDLRAGANALTWNAEATGQGLRQIEIRLTDTMGAQHDAAVAVNVVPPLTVRITAPAPNTEIDAEGGAVEVAYEIEANAGNIQRVALLADGAEVDDSVSLEPAGALTWDPGDAALGAHTLTVVAMDANDHRASDAITVTVTRRLSVAVGLAPGARVAGSAVQVPFTLEGRPADVARAVFLVDDRRVQTLAGLRAGDNTLAWDARAVDLGLHTLEIRLTDTLGNEISDAVTVNVVEPLAVRITAPAPNAVLSGPVSVGYAIDARAAELYDIALRVDGVEVVAAEELAPEGALTWESDAAALGLHTLEVVVADVVGNTASASVAVRVARPLRVALQEPGPGALVAGSVAVCFTFEGLPSDIGYAAFLVDDRQVSRLSGLRAGENTVTWLTDVAGVGAHLLEVRVYDTTGALAASDSALVNVVPPLTVEIVAPAPNAEVAGNVTVRYRARANAADLARVALLVDGEAVAAAETPAGETPASDGALVWDATAAALGAHRLRVIAEDAAGHTEAAEVSVSVVEPITLDVLAPVQDEAVAGVVTVRFRVEANAADLARVALLVDGAEVAAVTEGRSIAWDTTGLAPGVHSLEVRAVDAAGNTASQTLSVSVRKAVTVRVLSPEPGARVAGAVKVEFSVEANAAALDRVTLLVDDDIAATLDEPGAIDAFTWDASAVGLGTHRLTVRAEDTAGNTGEAWLMVTVAEPLTVDLVEPEAGADVAGLVSVRYRATATGAFLETITLTVDGEAVETLDSPAAQGVIPWDTRRLRLGEHEIALTAKDSAGNARTAAVNVVVTRPLTVALVAPEADAQVTGEVLVRYETNAALDEIDSATLLVNDQEVVSVRGPLGDTVFTWDTTDLGAGLFTLAVRVRDVTGQTQASEPVAVQVIFQGNSLPIFLLIVVIVFALAVVVPLTLRRRRQVMAQIEAAGGAAAGVGVAAAGKPEAKAYLVSESGPTSGTRWLLSASETIVGRSRTRADVVVTGRSASRQHARISRRGADFVYTDLKAENPSLVNGRPLTGPYTLQEGDMIEVGDTRLRFTREA